MNGQLPYGVTTPEGDRYRNARVGALTGAGELESADETHPFRAVVEVLRHSLQTLGPYTKEELTTGLLTQLLPVDLDYLAIQLLRATYGDVQFLTLRCPHADCDAKIDVQPDLSDVRAESLPDALVADTPLPDGREIRLRLPVVADRIACFDLPDRRDRELVLRCTVDSAERLTREEVNALDDALLARLAKELLERSPRLDLSAELQCIECDRPFRFVYEPVPQLLSAMDASRPRVFAEIHQIAWHYHWSLSDILALSRSRRHAFLELIAAELDAARGLG